MRREIFVGNLVPMREYSSSWRLKKKFDWGKITNTPWKGSEFQLWPPSWAVMRLSWQLSRKNIILSFLLKLRQTCLNVLGPSSGGPLGLFLVFLSFHPIRQLFRHKSNGLNRQSLQNTKSMHSYCDEWLGTCYVWFGLGPYVAVFPLLPTIKTTTNCSRNQTGSPL
jgi:hypothetical protein